MLYSVYLVIPFPTLACFRMKIFVPCLLIEMAMIFFFKYCLSTNCFFRWRMGKRNVSWILFLMLLSLFVMYVSPVQQINCIMDQVERVFLLFFFYSLKKNDFDLEPLVLEGKVFQGTTKCCRTEWAAYVRNKAAL